MKEEIDNEMDSMLRRLGNTQNRSVLHPENGDNGSAPEVHLDVDELNAYAENALPSATRARYTDHLAECSRCRKIVSQLSQAAGLVFEESVSPKPVVSGLRRFLSSFFSPVVLRYAIPALGVIIVAALGLSVFRLQDVRKANLKSTVAQKTEPSPTSPNSGFLNNSVEERRAENVATKAGEDETAANKKFKASDTEVAKVNREATVQDEPASSDSHLAAAEPAPAPAKEAQKAKEPSDEKKASGRQELDDAQRGQAVAVAPSSISVEQQKELAKTRDSEGGRLGGFATEPSRAKNETRRARSQPSVGSAEVDEVRRADKDQSETRSVAGHQFRRQGSIWVDVAYDSRATTNVNRDSEQYRALVADEPSIKTIADQLDGEIVVMWKNRAYRIR